MNLTSADMFGYLETSAIINKQKSLARRRIGYWHVLTSRARIISQAARLAEIEANRKPVYEDKPIIARGWESETAAETAKEVQ